MVLNRGNEKLYFETMKSPRVTLETLGPVLKDRRGGRGLRAIAPQIGTSAATLSRIESGKQPDLETFAKLCTWLGVDGGEVLGCSGKKQPVTRRKAKPLCWWLVFLNDGTVDVHSTEEDAIDAAIANDVDDVLKTQVIRVVKVKK